MSKPIPSVQRYMTTAPHSVGTDQTIAHAQGVMRELHIRHLPVLSGGRLVGMITERDIALIATLKDVDAKKLTVEEAMSSEVYAVSPEAPLDEVAKEMGAKKYGSAVVVSNEKVVGIVTTVDLANALHALLHGRLAN